MSNNGACRETKHPVQNISYMMYGQTQQRVQIMFNIKHKSIYLTTVGPNVYQITEK